MVKVHGMVKSCEGDAKCKPEPFSRYIAPAKGSFVGGKVLYYGPYSKRNEWKGTHKLIATKYSLFDYKD